jgi:hypothetical protein
MTPFYADLLGRFHELHTEIEKILQQLPQEAMDWFPTPGMNSFSVLIVHLTGAERFLVGDLVMGDPSNRDREAEFEAYGWKKDDLLQRLKETETYIAQAFEKLTLTDLETTRLHPRHGRQVSVTWALTHALEHAALHLGNLEITAQLWQESH